MRIGGVFTFGQQAVPIGLLGGQMWYMPPGNYAYSLGVESVLQLFDSTNLVWRNVAWPGEVGLAWSADGSNYRIVNLSGVVTGVLVTSVGSGYATNGIGSAATGVTVAFNTPAAGVAATAYPIIGGKLNNPTITQAGSGFTVPPMIFIDPPPAGGVQAVATAQISVTTGAITTVTLQNAGAGYTTVPNYYVVAQWPTYQGIGAPVNAAAPTTPIPPGVIQSFQPPFLPGVQWGPSPASSLGALITSGTITGSGTLTGVVMTGYGQGYTAVATCTVATASATTVGAGTAIMSFAVTSLTTGGTAGAGYTAGGPWISSDGLVAATDGCNGVYQIRPARGVVNSTTGFTSTAATVEDPGFGIQKVPNVGALMFNTDITTVSSTTASVGGVYDVSYIQPAVED